MNTMHPGGEIDILLKSNVPSSAMYYDILGLCMDCHSKFNANVHCLSSQKNKYKEDFLSVLQSPEMKCFSVFGLIVLICFVDKPQE